MINIDFKNTYEQYIKPDTQCPLSFEEIWDKISSKIVELLKEEAKK